MIGDRIEAIRRRHKITQAAVAEALGVTVSAYSEKCTNRRNAWRIDDLPKIQAYFEQKEGMPMPGWPVLDEAEAKALGGLLGLARVTGPHVDGGGSEDPERAFGVIRNLLVALGGTGHK